jgi:hypothetical protein
MPKPIKIKIPESVEAVLGPLAAMFGETIKRSINAAVDSALEDAEDRIADLGDRVRRTRKKTRRKEAAEPEAPSRVRRR